MTHGKMALRVFLIFLLAIAFLAGCSNDESGKKDAGPDSSADEEEDEDEDTPDNSSQAEILWPAYPFWPNEAFRIDQEHLAALAASFCSEEEEDSERFFLGRLPLASFDLVCLPGWEANPGVLMGNLYLSGYFGGLWLRDAMDGMKNREEAGDFEELRFLFQMLARTVAGQTKAARRGSRERILAAAKRPIPFLLYLYGYNLGYLTQIIENPPEGISSPSDKLICDEDLLLDCTMPEGEWDFLRRHSHALEELRNPTTARWEEMALAARDIDDAVQGGGEVWEDIGISFISAEDYELLVDLSIGFLLASRAAVLGNMSAWADENADEGRCSLLIDAGLVGWSGGYILGLISSAPPGTFPKLTCKPG